MYVEEFFLAYIISPFNYNICYYEVQCSMGNSKNEGLLLGSMTAVEKYE
jgi:hypothetical protein